LLVKRAIPVHATGRVYGVVYSGLDIGQAMHGTLGLNAPTVGPSGFEELALSTISGFTSGRTMNALRGHKFSGCC